MSSRVVDIRIQAKLSLDQISRTPRLTSLISRAFQTSQFLPRAGQAPLRHIHTDHTPRCAYRNLHPRDSVFQEPTSIVYTGESLSNSSVQHAGQGCPGLPGKDGRADDEILASHRVFGNVRSIDPEIFPCFLFDT
jgi:hypothetical protein